MADEEKADEVEHKHAENEEHVHHEHNEEHHKDQHEEHERHEREREAEKKTQQHEQVGEKRDLHDSRIAILVFTLAGVLMGAISLFLRPMAGSYAVGFVGIVLDIIVLAGMAKAMKRKTKFFLAGFFIYLLVWLVAWIFVFNMAPA
jgi:cation transport ATPase